jgi:ubiquinone/menaquinone biosynthesis C-methylase UbiE
VDVSAEELFLNDDADVKLVANVAEGLPFADGEVDLLVSRVVLEHVDGVPDAIAHMARVLKPGARTIHFVPGRWSTFALAARLLPFEPLLRLLHFAIPGSAGVVEFDVHYDQTDPVALERLFRAAGFREVNVSWTAAQADYFKAFLPAYVLVALYQTLVRVLGISRLAAYVVVDARR